MICLDATMWHAASFCWDSWYAPMGTGALGGGIFALRRPRPYSRHCGEADTGYAADRHVRHAGINGKA